MHIDSYRFGRMVIDGAAYASDLLIVHGAVRPDWWREAGSHVFAAGDLADIMAAGAETAVLGIGFFGLVDVRDDAVRGFQAAGTEVVIERTAKAVATFNRLAAEGRDVAAAFHLTC